LTALEWARWLSQLGLCVIPVPRPDASHDGKRPDLAWKEYQERRSTEAELRRWFRTEQNLAVVTGAVSGVVVVDVDTHDGIMWVRRNLTLPAWCVATARGLHAYFRHPGGRVANRARIETGEGRMAIDVRGDGGYVIAPGSVHASGVVYRPVGCWSEPMRALTVFPTRVLERRGPELPARPLATRPTGDLVERARRYLASMPPPIEGQGSDLLTFRAACRVVRGFGVQESVALQLLQEWAPHFDGWWLRRKIASALRYGEELVGGMR
jgi:hypothetical protein